MDLRKKITKLRRRLNPVDLTDYGKAYNRMVGDLLFRHGHDDAMKIAVGGVEAYDEMGLMEREILIKAGLKPNYYLVNVGCGSGRLELALRDYLTGPLLGTDVVPSLLEHARTSCRRSDWRFVQVESVVIPLENEQADMVCFFSVLTHTLHEDSFRYLCEASRVLRSGGRVVMSFLEFASPPLWRVFEESVSSRAKGNLKQHNQFISRDASHAWAHHSGFEVVTIYKSDDPEGDVGFGQSVSVLEKA